MVMETINIHYHKHHVGALSFDTNQTIGYFEYTPEFIKTGIELSPLKMPLARKIYSFAQLNEATFKGLPGLIADSLPDDFGNAVLNQWIASQGKSPEKITPLQRLQYTGKRGMGALTYAPATSLKHLNASKQIEIDSLVNIAQEILNQRTSFNVPITNGEEDKQAMLALMSVGMSAGGARPKAVIAFNDDFSSARSGQTDAPKGYHHYLMKFDGVSEHNQNQEIFGDPMGYGAMEYVYYLLAKYCGLTMMKCHLLSEGNRKHFITKRFDRIGNHRIHVQTLNGLNHVSYKQPGHYSYAELLAVARQLKLPVTDAEQILRRMIFNIIARNHDDHSKNFAFMLNNNQWQLAPAYDLTYSYKPGSKWVNSHWMTLNGKRDNFNREDIYTFEQLSPIFTKTKIDNIIEQTKHYVSLWPTLAEQYEVPTQLIKTINQNLRLHL